MKKLIITSLFFSSFVFTQVIENTVTPQDVINQQDKAIGDYQYSQRKIDALDEQSKILVGEYKDTVFEFNILKAYDDQLEKIVNSQKEEIIAIKDQIESLDETNKFVLPLLQRMVDDLKVLISLDIPFLMDERSARVSNLEDMIDKANFTTAEKFRLIYEAIQTEYEYGKTIETYTGKVTLKNGDVAAVDFFRLGRLNLFYRTTDGEETGYWNKNTNSWEHLGGKYSDEIFASIKIALKQAAPDFIMLPVKEVQND